jgi:hypothetical protein
MSSSASSPDSVGAMHQTISVESATSSWRTRGGASPGGVVRAPHRGPAAAGNRSTRWPDRCPRPTRAVGCLS